jgi:hypothetical protein
MSALSKRIPEDVRERARRAGARDLDWYAGRLERSDDRPRAADVDAQRRAHAALLRRRVERRAALKARAGDVAAKMTGVAWWGRVRRRRAAG